MALPLVHVKGSSKCCVRSLELPDWGACIVSVSGGQVVITSEVARSRQRFLRGHEGGYISAFALGNLGRLAATGQDGRNCDVVLWDITTGQQLSRFCEHTDQASNLVFSSDDKLCLSVGSARDQRLFVLDTSTGNIVCKHNLEWGKHVSASAFSTVTGDTYAFAVAFAGELVLYSLNPFNGMLSPRPVVMGSVRRMFTCLVYSPDGQWLYAGTASGDVVTVNVLRGAVQLVHPACSNGVGAMVLSSSGRLLVAGGDGSITMLSNDHMWRDIRPFMTIPHGSITSMSPNSDGSALLIGTADGSVYRVNSGLFSVEAISQGHAGPITRVSCSSQLPGVYATASQDGRVLVFDSQDHSLQQSISADPSAGMPLSMAITPGLVLSGWEDGTLRAFSLAPLQGKAPRGPTAAAWAIPGAHQFAHSQGVTALAVAHSGKHVATGGQGGEVRVWDMLRRTMIGHMKQHTGKINDLNILGDDMHLIAASEDRTLTAWDTTTHKCRATWRTTGSVQSVTSAGDQMTLVSAGHEPNLTIWDLRSSEAVLVVKNAHVGGVGAVDAAQGLPLLASGGIDSMVRLWDLRTTSTSISCQPLATGQGHTGPVSSIRFLPGGQLLSGGADGAVCVWQP